MANTILGEKEKMKERYVPDPELVKKVEDRLVANRVYLLFREPFWGQLACRMDLIDASGWCPTAATDGVNFYYNVEFIESLNDQELIFLFAHEILHVAYDHFMRRNSRDPDLMNAAADYAINGELVHCGLGDMPRSGLYDKKFLEFDNNGTFSHAWSSEQIYDWLHENAEESGQNLETLDMHLEPGEGTGGDGDGEGNYTPGDAHNAPNLSEGKLEEIAEDMKSALIQASQSVDDFNQSAGSIPAGLRRLIKGWTQPKIKWTDLLDTTLKSSIKSDYTYMKPHRRGELEGGFLMAGNDTEEMIEAHVAIDTSGSMYDEMLVEIMTELQGIMEQFTEYKLHVWCFDGRVWPESYKVFTQDNFMSMADYKLYGGGGTTFEANWDWMKENQIEPETLLFFTDGYPCGTWGDPKYCDTIFVIHGNFDKNVKAPFGLTVYYEDAK